MTLNHGFTIGAATIICNRNKDADDAVGTKKSSKQAKSVSSQRNKEVPAFLFIHINKTGCTHIIDMLRKKCKKEYITERWEKCHRSFNSSARSYIEHYSRESWDNAHTFAVVRHPLARQVSSFFLLCGNIFQQRRRREEEERGM